jgi:4-oxalocrotonate tautomerase
MPLVNIKGIGGHLTSDQKKELISKVTEAVLAVEGEGLRDMTWSSWRTLPPALGSRRPARD